ncbi:class I SAM-dependent methyltransferase [Tumidithrix elongata RA019]|uniref:Class I SAM-dependent methyltransferase n=1 Tax=Tumidithrix elongata BACA0141 TaxID=2716417 RepID=A0AAW9Q4W9_9CYAN|nr:class I SAM-dependent methyltransferase [Tumidithrix elongata RA019]
MQVSTTDLIRDQIEYYRSRSSEYDEWFYRIGRYDRGQELNDRWFAEVAIVQKALREIGQVNQVLELASGTGIWTEQLLQIGAKIEAIDASAETIAINQNKLNSDKVAYRHQDIFAWEPEREYDLVFFSFWLSHVPPDLLQSFLKKVYLATRKGGQIFAIDSRNDPTSRAKDHSPNRQDGIYQARKLNDGREFKIAKIYYQPDELQNLFVNAGFTGDVRVTENYFIYARGWKST